MKKKEDNIMNYTLKIPQPVFENLSMAFIYDDMFDNFNDWLIDALEYMAYQMLDSVEEDLKAEEIVFMLEPASA